MDQNRIRIRNNYRTAIAGMIEPTPRTVPTKPRPQVIDTVGLIGPLGVRLHAAARSQLPPRLCIFAQSTAQQTLRITVSTKCTRNSIKINQN